MNRAPYILLLVVGFCLTGCQKDRPLRVGLVDTVRIVESDRETAGLRMEWTAEANKFYLALSKAKTQKEFEALRQQIAMTSEEWREMTQAFMTETVTAVEKETAEVAKAKGIDIVVAGNRYISTVQYFNDEDITLDVLIKMGP